MPSTAEHDCKRILGDFLKTRRLKMGLSLGDVATAIGRSKSYVCDVENGRRGGSTMPAAIVAQWAEYLEIPVEQIAKKQELPTKGRIRTQNYRSYMKILRSRKRSERLDLAVADTKRLLDNTDFRHPYELADVLEAVKKNIDIIDTCLMYVRKRNFRGIDTAKVPSDV